MTTTQTLRHFVGGQWRPSTGGDFSSDRNPSDSADVVALVPSGSEEDVAAAVASSGEAVPGWQKSTGAVRAEYLYRWSASIAARQEELVQAMVREVGKPITEARGEVGRCVAILRYYAGEAVRGIGEVIPSQYPDTLQFTLRQPLGVVALITPWNFPLAIPLWKVAPAIAFGNTVVWKPAEAASHVATLLCETAAQADLPAGVFNTVLGSGSLIGQPLLRHEQVRGVSFTGSCAVGARVAATASERNIRYQTEMGGKNVAIVLPDADLDLAASLIASGAMRYAGQKCTATSRAVIDRRIEDALLSKLKAQVDALMLGPVTDPRAAVGPLISEEARNSVRRALEASSARPVVGGASVDEGPFARGYFFKPTIVAEVDADSPLAQEELFGPVLAVLSAGDLEEAISLANRTRYGLSASLFTKDIASALKYIHLIEAGLVRVNGDTTGVDPHAPFGGFKDSSSGSREQGPAALDFYTEIKTVQVSGA